MNIKTTISISEARKKIFKIAQEVQKPSNYYTLTENGRPKAVIISAEEFESLMENLEILSNPKIMADIKKAEEEYKRGEYVTWDEFKKELYQKKSLQPSLISDKSKKSYIAKKDKRQKTKNKKNR